MCAILTSILITHILFENEEKRVRNFRSIILLTLHNGETWVLFTSAQNPHLKAHAGV